MRILVTLSLITLCTCSVAAAQSIVTEPAAAQSLQPSQSIAPVLQPQRIAAPLQVEPASANAELREIRIPSGTPIDVESVYTVCSVDLKPGDLLSFRVLIPVMIDGLTAIEKGALVTARVTLAKRGGHWGRAGKLAWSMEDVVAADNTRIRLAPETRIRNEGLWSLEKNANSEKSVDQGRVTGISHGGEVATKTVVLAAAVPFLAPIALMQGFRRGENAVLPEGKRFVVAVRGDANVKAAPVVR